jgi:alanine dehydrogenase
MRVGILKEIKEKEYRVGMTPGGVKELVSRNHEVMVQQGAGVESGFGDELYQSAGAKIKRDAKEIFQNAELIVKVKEPQPVECKELRSDQILFTYLHLAADLYQTDLLLKSGVTAIAYETVTDDQGGLPLLAPMSEVAGLLSVQIGAHWLEKSQGGRGILLGGVAGVAPATVLILGGGVAGTKALRAALGMGANVVVVDKSLKRLRELDNLFLGRVTTAYPNSEVLQAQVERADLVIGAVLVPGAATPKLISRDLLKRMQKGSVIVDVAIDQGGCIETSKPTSFGNPTYVEEGVIHYCVTNIPSSVSRTSSIALCNATIPFVIAIADKGYRHACLADRHLLNGLNVYQGQITHPAVAQALNKPCITVDLLS